MSFFDNLKSLPEDPILSLPISFSQDLHPIKVNLGIGAYRNEEGNPFVLDTVKTAEKIIIAANFNKEYLPIEGSAEFHQNCLNLIFEPPHNLLFCAQTIGGTSALRIGAEFLCSNLSPNIFISDPSWPNHKLIFSRVGMNVNSYPYYHEDSHEFNWEETYQAIKTMPPRSIIVLQSSCHNPTGISPTPAQWQELSHLIKKQKVFPFFDVAYQGFGKSLSQDVEPIKQFQNDGHEFLIAHSFSKNLGLYGERCGFLCAVAHNEQTKQKISTHIKQIIRAEFSNPPLHPAHIVNTILGSAQLKQQWLQELNSMKLRIDRMRQEFVARLQSKIPLDYSFMLKQEGLFSFFGLKAHEIMRLRQDYGIYLLENGRINIAGLNDKNMDYVVDAISTVLK